MEIKFEKLNLFFDKIKNLGFWQRIFGWWQIKNLFIEAYHEFATLISSFESVKEKCDAAENDCSILKNTVLSKEEILKLSEKKAYDQEKELLLLKEKLNQFTNELSKFKDENTVYKQTEINRKKEYDNKADALTSLTEQVRKDRQKELEDRQLKEIDRLKSQKETWARHEEDVKNTIKMICKEHVIEYIDKDKVPFKNRPDNTIKICDEFVIFDAKSPQSIDDPQNFPTYIKNQTESIKKYIKEENVRKDIYLVIPSNIVDVIKEFNYDVADYHVYVVTLDALKPIILNLKIIENYKYVNELTPEERENICGIIGKFAHMTKRRIQIDNVFAWEFFNILAKCKIDLPKEIIEKVVGFEKSAKITLPQDKLGKQIIASELESDTDKIKKEAEAKGVTFPHSIKQSLKNLPLYDGEELPKNNIKTS